MWHYFQFFFEVFCVCHLSREGRQRQYIYFGHMVYKKGQKKKEMPQRQMQM